MESLMSKIIAIAVGLLMVAVLVPIALTTLASANVTGVDPVVVTSKMAYPLTDACPHGPPAHPGHHRNRALASLWPTHYAAKFHSEDEVGGAGTSDPSRRGSLRPNA